MSVCPKCGFINRSHWRQNRWRTNVYFLKYLDYPEDADPRILSELKQGHEVVLDKLFAYRFSGPVLERVVKQDYEVGGISAFHIPAEKARSKDPLQHRLFGEAFSQKGSVAARTP